MFSGIIEEVGKVSFKKEVGSNVRFGFNCSFLNELKIDQSVAHNGVCLTVVDIKDASYLVDVIAESLAKSNLGELTLGDPVNLERSLRLNDRLDGHIVQGHVDQTAKVVSIKEENGSWIFSFNLQDSNRSKLLIQKGSVSVNGVSLTISALSEDHFEVSIIPYTYEHTNFNNLKVGDNVNIEFDILGKYVERMLGN